MCGLCLEYAYFAEGFESLGCDPMYHTLHLMESPEWRAFYQSLEMPTSVQVTVGMARELEERIDGTVRGGLYPSHGLTAEQWASWATEMRAFEPAPCLGDFIDEQDFVFVPCDKTQQQACSARYLREFLNRYFELPENHHLRLEGKWDPWPREEEVRRFYWVYLAVALSTPSAVGVMECYSIAFSPLKRPPSFTGWELWIQRRALATIVMDMGVGVFNANAHVRFALLKGARLRIEHQRDNLERTLADLQRIESAKAREGELGPEENGNGTDRAC